MKEDDVGGKFFFFFSFLSVPYFIDFLASETRNCPISGVDSMTLRNGNEKTHLERLVFAEHSVFWI